MAEAHNAFLDMAQTVRVKCPKLIKILSCHLATKQ